MHVVQGAGSGLTATGAQLWSQSSGGIADGAEAGDRFAASLTAGTYRAGVRSGLVVGVPGESVGNVAGAGALNVLYGGDPGLVSAGNAVFTQNTTGIADSSEADDAFATAVG